MLKEFLRKIGRGWIKFGKILGAINQRIIMTLLYVTAIAITSILMRIFRNDPLSLRAKGKSFWHEAEHYEPTTERYRRLG